MWVPNLLRTFSLHNHPSSGSGSRVRLSGKIAVSDLLQRVGSDDVTLSDIVRHLDRRLIGLEQLTTQQHVDKVATRRLQLITFAARLM